MSAQTTIAKLRKSLADAQAAGMADQAIIDILADAARQSPEAMRNLLAARDEAIVKNRSDVANAIETLLVNPPILGGTGVAKAVADSLGTEPTQKERGDGNDLEDAFAVALRPALIQARDNGSAT